MRQLFLFYLMWFSVFNALSQHDAQNGDWKNRQEFLSNTSEALYMIRLGDIDNLGYGWENNFNPFSGKSTPVHEWPLIKQDSNEINGFDMAMLGSSYTDNINAKDGYSQAFEYLKSTFNKTVFEFTISTKEIDTSLVKQVLLQLFVDDFQPVEIGSKFQLYINGKRAPFAEKTLNALHQTGPIGKLITLSIPAEFLNEFKKDKLTLLIDDKTTGLGDGFAIDFFKILYNPKTIKSSNISGIIKNSAGQPLLNALITCGKQTVKTNAKGEFKFINIPAGLALISVVSVDKKEKDFTVDVEIDSSNNVELTLD